MSVSGRLRVLGRWVRAKLFPVRDVPTHLTALTRRTAVELGAQPAAVERLESLAQETCRETGLGSIEE